MSSAATMLSSSARFAGCLPGACDRTTVTRWRLMRTPEALETRPAKRGADQRATAGARVGAARAAVSSYRLPARLPLSPGTAEAAAGRGALEPVRPRVREGASVAPRPRGTAGRPRGTSRRVPAVHLPWVVWWERAGFRVPPARRGPTLIPHRGARLLRPDPLRPVRPESPFLRPRPSRPARRKRLDRFRSRVPVRALPRGPPAERSRDYRRRPSRARRLRCPNLRPARTVPNAGRVRR